MCVWCKRGNKEEGEAGGRSLSMGRALWFFLLCIEESVIKGYDMREREREMGVGGEDRQREVELMGKGARLVLMPSHD